MKKIILGLIILGLFLYLPEADAAVSNKTCTLNEANNTENGTCSGTSTFISWFWIDDIFGNVSWKSIPPNDNHSKILERANKNNKNTIESHQKALKKIELQNDSIEHLTKEKEIHNNKILTITEQLSEQRKIITDLTDTIKNISN